MIICDLCIHFLQEGKCRLDLKIPKTMACREFQPEIQKFCANPKDFVDSWQIVEMAKFFGIKGPELKKVNLMAASAESTRSSLLLLGENS
ncbi:MAG TPA: hypothetical protein VI306_22845 [Pyrinomonadaceae bacterium]